MTKSKGSVSEIINSLKFYFMLGILLADRGEPESISSRALKEYVKDLKETGEFNDDAIRRYCLSAYQQLSTDFQKMFGLEVSEVNRSVKIVENYHKPSGR